MERIVWKPLRYSRGVRMVSFLLVTVMLVAAAASVYFAFGMPDQVEKYHTLLTYESSGTFDYVVQVKPNSLFDRTELAPGLIYFPSITEAVHVIYSYRFQSEPPLEGVREDYQIRAILASPEVWEKRFVLVPMTSAEGEFTTRFALPMADYNELIDTIVEETGVRSDTYTLTIEAQVHPLAESEFGVIDEVFTQTMLMTLEGGRLVVEGDLTQSQSGSRGRTEMVPVPRAYLFRNLSLGALGGAVVLFLYLLVAYAMIKRRPTAEQFVRAAKERYGDLIVEVEGVPRMANGQTVIPLRSLDDLARVAEEMARPLIYGLDGARDVYSVIDSSGLVKYEYERKGEEA